MASVMRGIVDQHIDGLELRKDPSNAVAQGVYVGEITLKEPSFGTAIRADPVRELCSCFVLDVEESHSRTLGRELLHDLFPDAACPTGHDHDPVTQAGVRCVFALPVFCHPFPRRVV
jgi:hypothetical protein